MDNTFGVFWSWYQAARQTKVFMYGATVEGARQMRHIWQVMKACPKMRFTHPMVVGAAALGAEVAEMKRWIDG